MNTSSITARTGSTADSVSTTKTKRYHPLLIALHWLIAILIFGAFFLAQGNEGGRERFEGSRENFQQQGSQPGNLLPNSQPGSPPQGFPPGGFPQEGSQNIFSAIGLHMIF